MYQSYRSLQGGVESINVVYCVGEAMTWLGLTDAPIPGVESGEL
jgi:hypothetical protein